MPCTTVKLGDTTAIVCSRGPRPKRCCACHLQGTYLCDWKLASGGLCNKPICPDPATEVAKDKHVCPEHLETYEKWKAAILDAARCKACDRVGDEREECTDSRCMMLCDLRRAARQKAAA